MKGKKATKRALLSSALSLVLCFSMLLGTTFAWFTDEASTAVNTIQSGTLEVDIVDVAGESLNEKEMQFVVNGNTGAPVNDDDILWEPGCTFATEGFKIVNLGNLALKYQLAINGVNGDAKLLEAIEFWITSDVNFADKTTAYDLETFVEKLEAEKTSEKTYYLVGHMDEDANNDYQGLSIEGIGITVYATQVDAEFDSFGNDYDKEAPLPWDGSVIDGATFMAKNVNGNVIEIYQANELAYLATPNAAATVALAAEAETPITDFAGYTIKLMNDLNLGDLPWTPIDLSSATFDGQGHTIYNLNVTGAKTAGLFGYASKSTILNLNVVGATVNSNHYAGAIAAHGLYAKIENCHVVDAQITTTVEQVGTGWDNGDKAGGIIGYLSGEPTAYVKGCSVTDTTVTGYRDIGGMVGIANKTAEVSGNTVKDTTVVVEAGHNYKGYTAKSEFDANAVVGETHANATVNNNSETNVTVIAPDAVVSDGTQLKAALENANVKLIALSSDVEVDADNTIKVPATAETVLDLNGYTISSTSDATGANVNLIDVRGTLTVKDGTITTKHTGADMGWNNSTNVFNVTAGGVLNIENATVENLGGSAMAFGVHLNNWGEVTLNVTDSTIKSSYIAIRVFNSGYDDNNVDVHNSTLSGKYALWVHNYIGDLDSSKHSDEAINARLKFDLYDGTNTFISTSKPATPILYGFNNDMYFTADGAKAAYASDNASLSTAISGGADVVVLGSGTYIIPDSAQGKTLTITGNGDTVVATQDDGSYEGCDYSLDGATVTFNNITINTDSTTYTGYARCNGTYNNCTINGTYTLYGNSVFNNCTFNVTGDVYNIWTWGAPTATFKNCTFNSDGKAMMLYGTVNTKLTVDGCTFNDNGGLTDLKAAIEIGNDYGTSYELIVKNTTVNGYEINDKGINTGTTLWANKNSMGTDKLNVVVDGVDVY